MRKRYIKVRDVAGTEVYREVDTGDEFFWDFIADEVIYTKRRKRK